MIIVTANPAFAKKHCRMYDTNFFFLATMDQDNFAVVQQLTDNNDAKVLAFMQI